MCRNNIIIGPQKYRAYCGGLLLCETIYFYGPFYNTFCHFKPHKGEDCRA